MTISTNPCDVGPGVWFFAISRAVQPPSLMTLEAMPFVDPVGAAGSVVPACSGVSPVIKIAASQAVEFSDKLLAGRYLALFRVRAACRRGLPSRKESVCTDTPCRPTDASCA